jgi:multiple PDZ domain protein
LVRINQIEILLKIVSVDLDLVVDASIDEGVNGCCISSITSTSIDNYLQPGDFIVSLNHENMRKISNAQARAIIRRAALIGSDIRYYEQSLFLMFFLPPSF